MPNLLTPIHRLLLVEADEDDYFFLKECLPWVDPAIELYHMPQFNLGRLREEGFVPDLIFLDFRLPGRDSFACLREICCSALAHVPVVVYATSGDAPCVAKAYRYGASLYLVKPTSFKEIVSCLETVLKKTDWREPESGARFFNVNGKYVAPEVSQPVRLPSGEPLDAWDKGPH